MFGENKARYEKTSCVKQLGSASYMVKSRTSKEVSSLWYQEVAPGESCTKLLDQKVAQRIKNSWQNVENILGSLEEVAR